MSALGLEDAKDSLYASSKLNGEESIKNNLPSATILKPSIVYSVDDKFTTKFMSMLSLLPIFLYIITELQNFVLFMHQMSQK